MLVLGMIIGGLFTWNIIVTTALNVSTKKNEKLENQLTEIFETRLKEMNK